MLVTKDWGRKEKEILDLIVEHQVHTIFVPERLNLRSGRQLLKALLTCEQQTEDLLKSPKRKLRHVLRPSGNLKPLG